MGVSQLFTIYTPLSLSHSLSLSPSVVIVEPHGVHLLIPEPVLRLLEYSKDILPNIGLDKESELVPQPKETPNRIYIHICMYKLPWKVQCASDCKDAASSSLFFQLLLHG